LHFENHFDVPKDTRELKGVTIVWTAPHPEQGGRAVVGIWHDATVYREDQKPTSKIARSRSINGEIAGYRAKAKFKDCIRLLPDVRPIFVRARQSRKGESWPGQQKVFYPKSGSVALKRLNEIIQAINRQDFSNTTITTNKKRKPRRSNWQADVERRHRIEVAAIEAVGKFLENAGYGVNSVEKENRGYDLVAKRGDETLHVEVKGRSGKDIAAEFSVNEFQCLLRYQALLDSKEHYRVAIVTNALSVPIIHEFVLVRGRTSKDHLWCTLDGQHILNIEERTAARLSAARSNLRV
jgi:hypothetical protein